MKGSNCEIKTITTTTLGSADDKLMKTTYSVYGPSGRGWGDGHVPYQIKF